MTVDPHAMLDAALDSAIEISVIGLGAVIVQHLAVAAMIDPSVPGVLYGIAAVLVATSKLVRALYGIENPDNWIEKKLKRLSRKKGRPDDSDNSPAK
ncbi:hypothetical protein UFOVP178_24 [uncultured Caudovirales phage]|uniref:Uncharacterized protein n=1 Tax=uncultured Caudovirales phage TaxID=2100421 RepID=A0A6J7WBF5_9CAUD|nr:hypothetical protein UFOVP178_24 [uncultured Caudovirales phage]